MPRSIWSGNLSFGLVTIPVELYTAVRDQDFDFTMLDRRDNSPVGYKRVNKVTGDEVPYEDIVKGYEIEKGEYVLVTAADIKAANVESTQTVDIQSFVDRDSVPFPYMVKPYYVVPAKKSAKAYALLRETMRRTGRVALAKVVIRTRQRIAALYVEDQTLVLELLRFADEVLDPAQFTVPSDDLEALGVTDRELAMAEQLVEGLAETWDPTVFRDEYHDDLLALIEKKAAGKRIPKVKPATGEPTGEVIDIMKLLQRSLAATKPAPAAKKKPAKKATA